MCHIIMCYKYQSNKMSDSGHKSMIGGQLLICIHFLIKEELISH